MAVDPEDIGRPAHYLHEASRPSAGEASPAAGVGAGSRRGSWAGSQISFGGGDAPAADRYVSSSRRAHSPARPQERRRGSGGGEALARTVTAGVASAATGAGSRRGSWTRSQFSFGNAQPADRASRATAHPTARAQASAICRSRSDSVE